MEIDNMAPMGGHLVGPTGSRSECYRLGSTTMTISSTTAMTGGTTEPRAVIKAADVFPDLHHKMSKKIAQLTKVIYHLNTKNEDRQFELEELNMNHQKEMQDILSDAASKIKRFKEELLEKLRVAHAREKKEAMGEFKAFKRMAKEREENIQLEFRERIAELISQVANEKRAFEESLARFQEKGKALKAALDTARTAASGNIAALREKHKAELEQAIRTGNEKFDRMITDQMQAQEDVRNSAETASKEARRVSEQSMDRLRKELTRVKEAALSAARRESEEELQAVKASFVEKLERALADDARHRAAALEENKKNEQLTTERKMLANEVAKLREDASAMMETSRLEEASLRRLLETASAEGRRLAKILTAAEATRDEALEARRGAGGEADVLRRRLSQEIDEKQSFQRESETELAFKDAELASRLGEIESLRQKLQEAISNGKELKQRLERELLEAREAGVVASARANEMEKDVRAAKEGWEQARSEGSRNADDLSSQLERVKKEVVDSKAALRGKMDAMLAGAREEAARAATEASAKAIADMEALREASERDVRELSEHAKRKEEELLKQLGERTNDFKSQLENDRAAHMHEKMEAKKAMEDLRLEMDTERSELKRRLTQGESEAGQAGAQWKAQMEALTEEIEAAKSTLALEKAKAGQHHREAEQLAEELEQARAHLDARSRESENKLEEQRATAEANIRALEDRVVRETAEQLERAAASAAAKLEVELGRLSRDLRSEHEAIMAAAVAREGESANARHELALRKAERLASEREGQREVEHGALMAAHKERLDKLEASRAAEIFTLTANAQTEKDAAVGRLQSDLREQAARSTRELHDIRVAFAREKDAAVAAAVSSAVSNLTVQLETAREKVIAALKTKLEGERDAEHVALERIRGELRAKEEQLTQVTRERDAAHAETDAAKRSAELEARRLREATQAREAALVSKHAVEMSHAVGRQRDELRDAEERFREKEQNLTARVDALHADQERLERRYDNRPSREEDIARVHALEAAAANKDILIAKTLEEMAAVKRELVNREENYNKKFNVNPVVGVMQVIKPKDLRRGSDRDSRASAVTRGAGQPQALRYSKTSYRSASLSAS